jgi:hypothetical protein
LAAISVPLSAQPDKKHDHDHGDKGMHAEGGEDMAKMMEQFMQLSQPGEHHGHLKPMAGTWNIAGKFRMSPDMPWTESNSMSESKWILGGRFLSQSVKGDPMPPMPENFEGFGLIGYDNMQQKYISTWCDNMGTMIMMSEGDCDKSGKIITMRGDHKDCMTGQDTYMRSVYKLESPDRYVLEMYMPGPDGKEFLGMTLTHTRAK